MTPRCLGKVAHTLLEYHSTADLRGRGKTVEVLLGL
nr:MAG TPA: hypothetical protein [Caudoviricetes sp.]